MSAVPNDVTFTENPMVSIDKMCLDNHYKYLKSIYFYIFQYFFKTIYCLKDKYSIHYTSTSEILPILR